MNFAIIAGVFISGLVLGILIGLASKKRKKVPATREKKSFRKDRSKNGEKGTTQRNIFVGNLSRDMTEVSLRETFEVFGKVESANIIRDKETGKQKKYGFVSMPNREEAEAAIAKLHGREVMGFPLTVNFSKSSGRSSKKYVGRRQRS